MLADLVPWILGLLGLGGVFWSGWRFFRRLQNAPAALPPPPMPNPAIIARAAAREVQARQRLEREAVGPPTIEGAQASGSRLREFERGEE